MAEQSRPRAAGEWVIRPAAVDVAEVFCERMAQRLARRRREARGPLSVALTGGHSAHAFYHAMAARFGPNGWRGEEFRFFWSDERLVPPEHPDSNYRLALESLLAPAGIAAAQVHRVPTEAPDAPARYAQTLRQLLPPDGNGVPRLDVLILGMGDDGHTASLFPHTDLYCENERLVRGVPGTPEHPHDRATFTPMLINAAEEVWFLLTGEGKADATARLYARDSPPEDIPALVVDPARTRITHFVDAAAARHLPPDLRG